MSDFQKAISLLRSEGINVSVTNFEQVQVAHIETENFRGSFISKAEEPASEVKGLHYANILLRDMKYKVSKEEIQLSIGEQDVEELTNLIASVNDLKCVERDYGIILNEHAELTYFKQIAEKYLTAEQLEVIQEELEDIPEISC